MDMRGDVKTGKSEVRLKLQYSKLRKREPILDSKPNTEGLGFWVKVARVECGLSQKELANQIGLKSATAISLIEKNQRGLDVQALRQIAHVTARPVSFFFPELRIPEPTDEDYDDIQASE